MTPNEEHFRKLERMYHGAPINRIYEPVIRLSEGRAELTMVMKPDFFHAANAVHGSVYFKALDDACFFAVASLVEDVFVVTASFTTYLLKPIASGEMRAVGEVTHRTKSSFLADAVVYDSEGQQIARGSGSFVRSQIKLTPEIGYA